MHYLGMGAHHRSRDGKDGVEFAVWAPSASAACVVADFNGWQIGAHPMHVEHGAGIWRAFVPGVQEGARYKFAICAADGTWLPLKADPYAFRCELRPDTASIVTRLPASGSNAWTLARGGMQHRNAPMAIYEVHLGSWQRVPEEGNRFLSYDELADRFCRTSRRWVSRTSS